MRKDIKEKLSNLNDDELFECYSAFNGFGVYKTIKFKDILYDGEKEKYFDDSKINSLKNNLEKKINLVDNKLFLQNYFPNQNCEHIFYHINAIRKNNAKIMISKDIIF